MCNEIHQIFSALGQKILVLFRTASIELLQSGTVGMVSMARDCHDFDYNGGDILAAMDSVAGISEICQSSRFHIGIIP